MIEVLIASLAIWKITLMFMDYDGPFNCVKFFRETVNKLQTKKWKALNFECFFCFSTVVAFPFSVLIADGFAGIVTYWFGLSGLALLIYYIQERLER